MQLPRKKRDVGYGLQGKGVRGAYVSWKRPDATRRALCLCNAKLCCKLPALLRRASHAQGRPGPLARPRCKPPGAGAPKACSPPLPPPNRPGGGGPAGERP